jgi:hypothetical protein
MPPVIATSLAHGLRARYDLPLLATAGFRSAGGRSGAPPAVGRLELKGEIKYLVGCWNAVIFASAEKSRSK